MNALLNPPAKRRTLSVVLDGGLFAAEELLQNLCRSGVTIHNWSLASTDDPDEARLTLDVTGDSVELDRLTSRLDAYDPGEATCFELVLVTVTASGRAQDEASAMIAAAGGRLLRLEAGSLTAQISNRSEKIEAMLVDLRRTARVEVVRSGPLMLRRA